MRRVRHALVVVPLIAVTACSGTSSGALQKARSAYLQQAEAVCQKGNDEQKTLKKPASATELSPFVDAVVRLADETTTAMLKLSPPKQDRAGLDQHVFTPLHTQLTALRAYADQVRAAASKHDSIALTKLLSDPPNKTAADLDWMRSYGFRQCVDLADTSG